MGRIEFRAAAVTWHRAPGSCAGVLLLNFYGLLNAYNLESLSARLIPVTIHAPALVARTDQALVAMQRVPLHGRDDQPTMPAAIVVRREHRDLGVEYGRRQAEIGLTRAVFVETQLELALRWAERRAEQARALSPLGLPDKRGLDRVAPAHEPRRQKATQSPAPRAWAWPRLPGH